MMKGKGMQNKGMKSSPATKADGNNMQAPKPAKGGKGKGK